MSAEQPGVRRVRRAFAGLALRTRVSVLAALGVGLAVALTSVAAYATVSRQLHHQRDQTLLSRARAAVSSPLGDPARLVQVPTAALGAGDLRIALVRADTHAFADGPQSAPPLGTPELEVARGDRDYSVRTASVGGTSFRVVAVPAARRFALVLAQPTKEIDDTLRRLRLVLLLVGLSGVALAAYLGLVIARTGLRPVERLTLAAERVAATERLDPIEVQGEDEIGRLTGAFNAMLAALAASRDRQRALVADAGHELRTPLTSLRTNLDLLAQSETGPALDPVDRAELLHDVRAQIAELSALVGDLVELAREDESGHRDERPEAVELSSVVRRAVERVTRRAPGLHFDTDAAPWLVDGDPNLLERAVTNLLDNAAKWSPPGGTVTVSLRDGVLRVVDEGPGIAEHDLPHVFDRFYRSAEARTLPGSGLGLAIVRQAVERHGGDIHAGRAVEGGTVITARFPPASSPALG
ncbi:MAG: two-component system, OmpR family, sensor histidine kinase MprB [Actinomycetota bacterium]|nr:two-component system, OmpR family, sensor histidine kinase MprB [Actinomycetota bacterium]